jgi:hypothetical protein
MANASNRIGVIVLGLGLALGGVALAQESPKGEMRPMRHGMMSEGGGMGGGGMMGMCPMMTAGAQMKIEKISNGISISITSNDPKVVSRIQKRGEIMRLMRELREEEQ